VAVAGVSAWIRAVRARRAPAAARAVALAPARPARGRASAPEAQGRALGWAPAKVAAGRARDSVSGSVAVAVAVVVGRGGARAGPVVPVPGLGLGPALGVGPTRRLPRWAGPPWPSACQGRGTRPSPARRGHPAASPWRSGAGCGARLGRERWVGSEVASTSPGGARAGDAGPEQSSGDRPVREPDDTTGDPSTKLPASRCADGSLGGSEQRSAPSPEMGVWTMRFNWNAKAF
jgi:hypothetical protein